ncbi:unnamed protein product [Mytilus edulis]|uniref:CARD domain-containing protein n=1 Tax=Mytilus edulis TaxID=6550 RepID=A0A8S3QRH8_MYTED|nr:unnamed protein product [Mytilus edulis]
METHDRSAYQEFKNYLINSTILDTDVLDNLISKCILTLDDREEIDSLSDQSNRNQKLLEILMHRPYNTFFVFVEAMKNSDQKCHSSLVERMEAKVLDKDLTLQKAQLTDETTGIKDAVKLIKWYNIIVHEISIDKTGILDKLFTKDVIDREIHEKLSSVNMTSHEKNRRLLGILVRKDISSAFPIFLEVLREDSCYKDYADKIEETHVTQNDLELLSIDSEHKFRECNVCHEKTDIKDEVENRFREYQSFSIILPDDLVQQYIYRWFGDLTKSNSTKAHFKDNRLFKSVTFRIALNSFMRQINQETVGSIIRTGSKDFLNTMFVKTEHDIKDFAKEQYECFGIVIPERILQPYIDRWFHDLTRYSWNTCYYENILWVRASIYFDMAKIWYRKKEI